MAAKKELDFTYSTLDKIFRMNFGEFGDFSGALYDGEFTMTLEEAQRAKHQYIAQMLNISAKSRVLDLGCGWGPFMRYVTNEIGAECIGLTLSEGQYTACNCNGLDVHLKDCREIKSEDFGQFDAVVSIGAFEHFASPSDHKKGRQKRIYENFFRSVYDILPENGRFYLQTMVFGKNMLPHEEFDITAGKDTDAYILALMEKQFPESWLPYGKEMILECAEPYFSLKDISSGRRDYVETIRQWRKRFRRFSFFKYMYYLSLLPLYLMDQELKYRIQAFRISPNMVCFERELMDHFRIVFEKKG